MAARNRPVILGEDKEYSKVLGGVPQSQKVADALARSAPTRPNPETSFKSDLKQRDRLPPAEGRVAAAPEEKKRVDDKAPNVVVKPAVRPLDRQWEEMSALEASGFQVSMILRLALQQTQKNTVIEPNQKPVEPDPAGTGEAVRAYLSVPQNVISALSESIGDLGTMPASKLVRPQVQRAFIAELDKVIEKLKRKL